MKPWTCIRCATDHLADGLDPRPLGLYDDPSDPATRCERCKAAPPDALRTRLLVEALLAPGPHPLPAPRARGTRPALDAAPISPGGLYSLREVAKLLRLDRTGRLRAAIDAGLIRTVPVGSAERVSGVELLRVAREGLPSLPGGRRVPTARKPKRRRTPKSKGAVGSIADIPL